MKKSTSLSLIILLFLTQYLMAQNKSNSYYNIDQYRTDTFKSEFKDRFQSESDRNDFKKLREFKKEKEDLFDALMDELNYYPDNRRFSKKYDEKIDKLNSSKKGSTSSGIKIKSDLIENDYYMTFENRRIIDNDSYSEFYSGVRGKDTLLTITEIDEYIKEFTKIKQDFDIITKFHDILDLNLRNVKQDIRDCISQLDSSLAPEYKKQEFRKDISLYFTGIIALLLIAFFLLVYSRSDSTLSKDLLSGNGLQFITLFVLIIAVILFGILGILQSSELAAILSGISGYILGKGVYDPKNALSNGATNSTNVTNTDSKNSSATTPVEAKKLEE